VPTHRGAKSWGSNMQSRKEHIAETEQSKQDTPQREKSYAESRAVARTQDQHHAPHFSVNMITAKKLSPAAR